MILASLAWFGLVGSEGYSVIEDFSRETFPPWADSIAIPLFSLTIVAILGWVLLAPLAWFFALRKAELPALITIRRRNRPLRTWAFNICAVISILGAMIQLYSTLASGPFVEIPALFLWTYMTLSVRAAAISNP
jgi:hypothetical protein